MTYPFRESWYHNYGPRKGTLGLDFHMSEGGDELLDYLGDGGTPPLRGVSANFVNLSDGTIWRMLGWDETAGTLNPDDRALDTTYYGPRFLKAVLGEHWPDPNVWSLSMEIAGRREVGPTRAQVESAVRWAADMKARFPTIRGAFGHHDQAPKGCPGTTPNMLEIFRRIGGHGLWTTEVDMPGIRIEPQGTKLPNPLDAYVKATVKGTGHEIFRVADLNVAHVADGLDLGTVERAKFVAPLPAFANGDPNCVVFNYAGEGQYVAVIRDVTLGAPVKPADTTPYSKADVNTRVAAALERARVAVINDAGAAIDDVAKMVVIP